jgi:hypothetical protein
LVADIARKFGRDVSAEDARTFGIVDEVITKRQHPLDEKLQKPMPVS